METITNVGEAWDSIPRDGPAVFIASRQHLDEGRVIGGWIRPDGNSANIRRQLEAAVGSEVTDRNEWVLIDQISVGELMLPEVLTLEDLTAIGSPRTTEASTDEE